MDKKLISPYQALSHLTWRAAESHDITIVQCLEWNKIVETALTTNDRKLAMIDEILVDISKGNYADLNVAIDKIREVFDYEL